MKVALFVFLFIQNINAITAKNAPIEPFGNNAKRFINTLHKNDRFLNFDINSTYTNYKFIFIHHKPIK